MCSHHERIGRCKYGRRCHGR
ncbi:MAG: hypothetical protein F4X45_10135 [Chloroflexi bacterium]|nr:hypothetical protein [Chloroflexota bacterium]